MDNSIITISKLGFSFGSNEVLSIENLLITKSLTTVFLGSNGSGKTTFLKLLSGLIEKSRGTISNACGNLKEKTILVHQIPYLFSGSVKYNIAFVLKNNKIPAADREIIIKDVLKQTDLLHLLQRKTSGLSGGEKHRLAIARAIAVDPEILILDEPFAHIDIESRKLIETIICQRSESGKTTILSTHNLSSAYRLADKIIYLENGKIKEPKNNFFKGTISKRDDHFCTFIPENSNVTILAPASNDNYKSVVIPYSDIFLSKDKIETSAQNQLKGKITALRKKGSQYFVTIDCGIKIKAVITDISVKEFQLQKEKEIFVNFKASAVRLY